MPPISEIVLQTEAFCGQLGTKHCKLKFTREDKVIDDVFKFGRAIKTNRGRMGTTVWFSSSYSALRELMGMRVFGIAALSEYTAPV